MKKTGIEKNEKRLLKKSTLVEGEVIENSFCRLSPINASSDASIVDSSIERKVTLMGSFCIAGQPYYTSTNRRHRGRGATSRNQQHENFVISCPLSLAGSGLRRMVGITNIHLVRTVDTRITIEDC